MTDIQYLELPYELIERPLAWQRQGLQETATGYGAKLTSTRVCRFRDAARWPLERYIERRVYITCYSNNGSAWITLDGKRLYLRD